MKSLFGLLFTVVMLPAFSQIVNIEKERYTTDTTGWKGSIKVGFTMGKQNIRYFSLNTAAHVQYKSEKNLYLLLGSYDLLKTQDKDYINAGFLHFRYNYKIKKWVRWEAFTQAQFNRLLSLRLRFLLGTGPRFKLCQVEKFKAYMGYLYMFEYEQNTDRTQKLKQHRTDIYLSLGFRPSDNVEFSSTTYYQPLVKDLHDYRIASENTMCFKINKLLSFEVNFNMNFDSRPPEGSTTNFIYNWINTLRIDL